MTEVPEEIVESKLYGRLESDAQLLNAVLCLRSNCASLADTIARIAPSFTDHSIRHMDRLWTVTGEILTDEECNAITLGEAFVLATGFYLHDIGMAYAATEEGMNRIRNSDPFRAVKAAKGRCSISGNELDQLAIEIAVRQLHANVALELATNQVPGTSIYLLEPKKIRNAWGEICGKNAASHHWDLSKVDSEFGNLQNAPLPGGQSGDLGYVASILRLADYAHINRDRARTIDRAFRGRIQSDSLIHWLAQEQVDGPQRSGNYLIYRNAVSIHDVDAWWLFYDMLIGLDKEIRSVKRYLDRRSDSAKRFSLEGIQGTESPEEVSKYIKTSGFLPIEINVRSDRIDRLMDLLAGESLYGKDAMVPVRELIQNSADAAELAKISARSEVERATAEQPIRIKLETGSAPRLTVADHGIGMTRHIMTDYLVTLASDYWGSQFHSDFPTISDFKPAGRFGIGFLSAFMLGNHITVESNRVGQDRYLLSLRGVANRGEIRKVNDVGGSGTLIKVDLNSEATKALKGIARKIRACAPMIKSPIEISEDGDVLTIEVGWINTISQPDFQRWLLSIVGVVSFPSSGLTGTASNVSIVTNKMGHYYALAFNHRFHDDEKTLESALSFWPKETPEFRNESIRLLAGPIEHTVLCCNGIALQSIRTPGFSGIINAPDVSLNVTRDKAIDFDPTELIESAIQFVKPSIIQNLNLVNDSKFFGNHLHLISHCIRAYGRSVILESSARWITTVEPPGNSVQISCGELLSALRNASSLFIVYDSGPWTTLKRWSEVSELRPPQELAIVLDGGFDGDRLDYLSDHEAKTGKLGELWEKCETTYLFGTILEIAANAWETSIGELLKSDGWQHVKTNLVGTLSR